MSLESGELSWAKEMVERFAARTAHSFILHLNVPDLVKGKNGYISLKHYLTEELLNGWQLVVFYDRASGIHFLRREGMREDFCQIVSRNSPGESISPDSLPKDPEKALPLLEKLLRVSPEEASQILSRKITSRFAAVIIGFAETIFPDGAITSQSVADRNNIITIAQWARRTKMEESGNLIILMTDNIGQIAPSLKTADSNIEAIKVPYPDYDQRLAFIQQLPAMLTQAEEADGKTPLEFGDEATALAAAGAGLSRLTIKDLARQAIYKKQPLTVDFIWEHKGNILETNSGGLLEVVRPANGFEVIGGLEPVKKHFLEIANAIRQGDVLMVPQGILMAGPPGTGKSVMAEALAYELGFSLVKLKNLREMWVGQSERNQSRVFELIEALSPVVVFEDEIDQQETSRSRNVFNGDSGVSNRMAAEKMAFMANVAHRGRILWLQATNRPDLIDQASLRPGRIDDVIPFLPPNHRERTAIFKAIFLKVNRQAKIYHQKVIFQASDEEINELAQKMENYTGAEIELICCRAYKFALEHRSQTEDESTLVEAADLKNALDDFIPSRDDDEYKEMTDMALAITNSARMIPLEYRERARKAKMKKNQR